MFGRKVLFEGAQGQLSAELVAILVRDGFRVFVKLNGLELYGHVGQVNPAVFDPLQGEFLPRQPGETLARQPNLQGLEGRHQDVDTEVEFMPFQKKKKKKMFIKDRIDGGVRSGLNLRAGTDRQCTFAPRESRACVDCRSRRGTGGLEACSPSASGWLCP